MKSAYRRQYYVRSSKAPKVDGTVCIRMEVRDPVHGFVSFNGVEAKVLDTCVVQRLRRIRQLAYATCCTQVPFIQGSITL